MSRVTIYIEGAQVEHTGIANFAKKVTADLIFRGSTYPIAYWIDENPDPGNWLAWVNGFLRIRDADLCVGGAWIGLDRAVRVYDRSEMGDFRQLAQALHISLADEGSLDELYAALCSSLPTEWPEAAIII
jgi:hypothetical protein